MLINRGRAKWKIYHDIKSHLIHLGSRKPENYEMWTYGLSKDIASIEDWHNSLKDASLDWNSKIVSFQDGYDSVQNNSIHEAWSKWFSKKRQPNPWCGTQVPYFTMEQTCTMHFNDYDYAGLCRWWSSLKPQNHDHAIVNEPQSFIKTLNARISRFTCVFWCVLWYLSSN